MFTPARYEHQSISLGANGRIAVVYPELEDWDFVPSIADLFPTISTHSYLSLSLPLLPTSHRVIATMAQQTKPQQRLDPEDWRTPFCDPGMGADCPRSCFIGFDQFGRTRYRLDELDRDGNPMDMAKYKGCNAPCWDYCLLCFGGLCEYSSFLFACHVPLVNLRVP